jgi:CheY-like chemotaxis protein
MRTRKKILIVDDDLDLCHILQTVLDRLGYDTVLAVNGKEAVDLATSQLPDLILMDIMLPVMDGLQATRLIRENSNTQSTPILAMTARVSLEDKKNCFLSGCDDFIAKPFTVKEMTSCIEKLLKPSSDNLGIFP